MTDLAWDERLHQEEAEELQAGCVVRKKLPFKAVSFGLNVTPPLERGQRVCSAFFAVPCNKRGSFPVVLCMGTCCSVWQHPRVLQTDMYHVPGVEI